MSYGHGLSISNEPSRKPAKSAFVTYTWVTYTTPDGRTLRGQVVGPDQDYFPSPAAVFVSFPSTGFTRLLEVADLAIAPKPEGLHRDC